MVKNKIRMPEMQIREKSATDQNQQNAKADRTMIFLKFRRQ